MGVDCAVARVRFRRRPLTSLVVLTLALAWTATVVSQECTGGIPGYEASGVCCILACETCGGSGCGEKEGTTDADCCTSNIEENNQLCSQTGAAPCVIDTSPTASPTTSPPVGAPDLFQPTVLPTSSITKAPLNATPDPNSQPTTTLIPSAFPIPSPTITSMTDVSLSPTVTPVLTLSPTPVPSGSPTRSPTPVPSEAPTPSPTLPPTLSPTLSPTLLPTRSPMSPPTLLPTQSPMSPPTLLPTQSMSPPTLLPTQSMSPPTLLPTQSMSPPTLLPTQSMSPPTLLPTQSMSPPTLLPTQSPMPPPTLLLTQSPMPPSTLLPTQAPILTTSPPIPTPTPTQEPSSPSQQTPPPTTFPPSSAPPASTDIPTPVPSVFQLPTPSPTTSLPTTFPPSSTPTVEQPRPPEPMCSNDMPGYQNSVVCCPVECGQCGGSGCENILERVEIQWHCCSDLVIIQGASCEETGEAPCFITAGVSSATTTRVRGGLAGSAVLAIVVATRVWWLGP